MPFAESSGGARIAWTESGSGEAVLLVMGFGFGKEMWHRVIPALAERHRVISFDNRGVGRTVTPRGRWSMETMADDAMAVLDAAGEQAAHVYGASMGGAIAQAIALNHPERVRSLVLACTGARADNGLKPTWKMKLGLQLARFMPMRKRYERLETGLYGPGVDPAKAAEDIAILKSIPVSRGGMINQARAIAGFAVLDRLGEINVPTLVIHGTADKTVPYEMGVQLAQHIKGARLLTLEGAGHGYVTDRTEESNQAVLHFFAEVPAWQSLETR